MASESGAEAELHARMAETIGYVDGASGELASLDTTIIRSEFRADYLRGFAQGRAEAGLVDNSNDNEGEKGVLWTMAREERDD